MTRMMADYCASEARTLNRMEYYVCYDPSDGENFYVSARDYESEGMMFEVLSWYPWHDWMAL